MKLLIRANEKITNVVVDKKSNGEIYGVEISFEPSSLYSDLEFWLDDKHGKLCDHARMNLTLYNKMRFSN